MSKRYLIFAVFCLLSIVTQSNGQVDANPSQESQVSFIEILDSDTTSANRQSIFPITLVEIFGFILIMIVAGLANAGGLGGGPLLSPILIILFNYSESHAIEIVYALVFGASLGNFLNVVAKRDEKTEKPLIEYNLGLICMPPMLLGALFGVILNRMLAPLITIIGILAVTLFSLVKLYIKARRTYVEENIKRENVKRSMTAKNLRETILSESDDNYTLEEEDPQLKAVRIEEKRQFPPLKIAMTIILIACLMLIAVLRGTSSFESIIGASYCGAEYWGLLGLAVILCGGILFINFRIVNKSVEIKDKFNVCSTSSRFELSKHHIPTLLILSSIAGVLAGLLGIGGGMVMNPTLISIGVPAMSLAATAGFFVVQTSFISIFQSILYRDVPLIDLAFFFVISIIGSFGVSYLLSWLVKRYKRPSIVLFCLVVVLILSLITTPVFEIVSNIDDFSTMLKFSPVC